MQTSAVTEMTEQIAEQKKQTACAVHVVKAQVTRMKGLVK
jgi:hypothetical protein